jgi:hypothetical protein
MAKKAKMKTLDLAGAMKQIRDIEDSLGPRRQLPNDK